jgi:NAD(P)-dependent dehydrogenase (short-subunit alcohol dehydrogenase family)
MEKEMKLKGRAAIVTGAARGVGRGIALHLASLGASVLVADRDFGAAREWGEELTQDNVAREIQAAGGQSALYEGDLTRREAAAEMTKACLDAFGRVDILVNNAGGMVVPVERSYPSMVPDEDDRLIFDLNYRTMVHCCQAVLPVMKEQKEGAIVNVSSAAARYIMPGGMSASYGAAKAAVSHFTRSLALEVAPAGIRVNAMAPSVVTTARIVAQAERRGVGKQSDAQASPMGRFANVEDCAFVVEFLVTELSRYVTGQVISVCGGRHLTPA